MSASILYPFVKYTFDDGKAIYSPDLETARSLVGAGNKSLTLLGSVIPGDGGGGVFYWSPAYNGVDDGGITAFFPYAVGVGAWVRLPGVGSGTGKVTISDTAPSNPKNGDLWWNSSSGVGGTQLYIWYIDPTGPGQWVAASSVGGSPLVTTPVGAIADGNSHPLSSIASYSGVNTAGWTLAQWQTIFPFSTALSNEIDQCAVLLAIQVGAAQHTKVFVPGGRYQCNFAPTINVAGGFTLEGGGSAVTCFEVTNASATALPISMPVSTGNQGTFIDLRGFSVYSTLLTALGGNGIVINGSTLSSSGRPEVYFEGINCGTVGPAASTTGALAVGVQLNNVNDSWLVKCFFWGTQNTAITAPGVLAGVGFQLQGSGPPTGTTFFSFGPNMVDCEFTWLDRAVVIGNGSTVAWTQGAKFDQCTWDDCNYGIIWRTTASGAGNDYLSVQGCDLACPVKAIWTDTVQTHQITNNYFLCNNGTGLQIDNTGSIACIGNVAANLFCGFGTAVGQALVINSLTSQSAIVFRENNFFDFDGAGAPAPVVLNAATSGIVLLNNVFRDNTSLPSDLGTSNHWYNTTIAASSSAAASQFVNFYASGIPTAVPNATPGLINAITPLHIVDAGLNSINTLQLSAVNSTIGAGIQLLGNGATTPSKFIRAEGGQLQFLNNAYTQILLLLTDSGDLNVTGRILAQNVRTNINAAVTGTAYTMLQADGSLVLNPSGPFTLTLVSASANPEQIVNLKLISGFAVSSASANVVPLAGGSPGTAILTAAAGKWCTLQSDGSNWQIMAAN